MRDLRERFPVALVTGARTGLGLAFAEMLAAEGVRVWGTGRDPSRLDARFHPVPLDLADAESVDRAWRQAEAESGGIDLLVNNAGVGVFSPFADADLEVWEMQMDVLHRGPVRMAWHALRAMARRRRGCIVNVSSLAVEFSIPYMSGYNAGKAALSAFSESLELEARATGVSVIDFRPGDIRTDFNRSMILPADSTENSEAYVSVWRILEANLAMAPEPQVAARDLRRALSSGRSGVVRSGGWFQARLAPFLNRFAPEGVRRRIVRRYFGIR